ncbi:MAG: hypothetical protein C3F10_01145 [Dehalococcoidia bacterium]|nr:MAG: hypothetical protein C3F10_01145 [Dehalococcoidia bacterium]
MWAQIHKIEEIAVENAVYYVPVLTTVLSAIFATVVLRRWRQKEDAPHLLWWGAGIVLFGVGTFMEGWTAIFGWNEAIFRSWYISGALLGGAPLAQGTVYLLVDRKTADRLAVALVAYVVLASIFVVLTPLDRSLAEEKKLTGAVIEWNWVRAFSPLVNTYAFIFLVGGAVASALRYRRGGDSTRMVANILIAVGAILPGIGGSFTRAGYTEVLYVTEFVGIILIFIGYSFSTRGRPAGEQAEAEARAEAAAAG